MTTARLAQRPGSDPFLKSIQHWSTWTPTWANLTVGNGTVTAKYVLSGGTVLWRMSLVLGSTSTVGTGPYFTLPLQAVTEGASDATYSSTATYIHTSVPNIYNGVAQVDFGGSVVWLYRMVEAQTAVTATTPFTWTSGDIMRAQGFYEVTQ